MPCIWQPKHHRGLRGAAIGYRCDFRFDSRLFWNHELVRKVLQVLSKFNNDDASWMWNSSKSLNLAIYAEWTFQDFNCHVKCENQMKPFTWCTLNYIIYFRIFTAQFHEQDGGPEYSVSKKSRKFLTEHFGCEPNQTNVLTHTQEFADGLRVRIQVVQIFTNLYYLYVTSTMHLPAYPLPSRTEW